MRGDLADLPAGWVAAWSDGACAGNPGPMGIGGLVRDREGGLVAMFSEAAGRGTNNEAEYLALDRAIRLAAELGAEGVVVCSDSELVVRQLTGDYRVRNGRLHAYWSRARGAMTAFPGSVRLEWVSRVYNFDADALASRAVGMPQAPLAAEGGDPLGAETSSGDVGRAAGGACLRNATDAPALAQVSRLPLVAGGWH